MQLALSATRTSVSSIQRCASRPLSRQLFGGSINLRAMSVSAIKDVTPQEAYELLKSTKYLDVRTGEEFTAGHVPGAINIPVMLRGAGGMSPNPEFLEKVNATFTDKTESLIVGCKSGARSMNAAQLMTGQAAFTDILNLKGGFDAWSASGLPVEK